VVRYFAYVDTKEGADGGHGTHVSGSVAGYPAGVSSTSKAFSYKGMGWNAKACVYPHTASSSRKDMGMRTSDILSAFLIRSTYTHCSVGLSHRRERYQQGLLLQGHGLERQGRHADIPVHRHTCVSCSGGWVGWVERWLGWRSLEAEIRQPTDPLACTHSSAY
jgi:hypothetical protein